MLFYFNFVGSNTDILNQLKVLFPNKQTEDLIFTSQTSVDVNEAIDAIMESSSSSPSSHKKIKLSEEPPKKLKDLSTLVESFQERVSNPRGDDSYKLQVTRDEIWRSGLTFYKKSLKTPGILLKELEVL